jgi:hypothetical protein
MPRFFFNPQDDDSLFIDTEGEEFPDLEAAERAATLAAAEMSLERARRGRTASVTVKVTNGTGSVVFVAQSSLNAERIQRAPPDHPSAASSQP